MSKDREYTALFPFGGLGAGARGFLNAHAQVMGRGARFRCLGGIDFDAGACADFEYLTGSPSWCTDVLAITPEDLRERYGETGPDVVFLSPPCKGSSRLLSARKARTAKYQAMNRLAVEWTERMLAAWPATPPRLVLLENVPGLPSRAGGMLRELRAMLRRAGYVFHASTHDCGEIGGLAQHRKRFLLVARHPDRCPPLLYQPPRKRVRGVGEVLGALPMPATAAAAAWGTMHTMPRLSWRNWIRLALIPAGGDWRDLEGVLGARARREVFRRHAIADWERPIDAVTGPGGHSVEAVNDPRVDPGTAWNRGAYGVTGWEATSGTITGGDHPSKGRFTVADPRLAEALPVKRAYDAAHGVLGWEDAARTVAGTVASGTGAYAVADPRDRSWLENVRVLTLDEAMGLDLDPVKPPPFIPVIIAEDGTWHRPLTLLELAALQGIPSHVAGAPLHLTGTRTQQAEHIGNAVPVGAAEAIARRMLVALAQAEAEGFSLDGDGSVWVSPPTITMHA